MSEGQSSLIDLDQPLSGYRRFLSCWVWQGDGLTYIVDPGPASSIDPLLRELGGLGVETLDCVLLTHIHLDHAGGVARVVEAYPGSKVFCHPGGREHLVNPARLWKGSLAVLGDVARVYGEPAPLPEATLATDADLDRLGIRAFLTPGHAPHHVSFLHDGILYAGEALGTRLPLPSGRLCMRPATPPRFFPEEALRSIDLLRGLEKEPANTAFAHYGLEEGAFACADVARKQVLLWVEITRDLLVKSRENIRQRFFDRVVQKDPLYDRSRFEELEADVQEREIHYIGNTLAGILDHLES